MRVVRIYHAGRDPAHRERERALARAGVEVTLVVPRSWPGPDDVTDEPFEVVQLPVARAGDVNRHHYIDPAAVVEVIGKVRPDVVDLHEEMYSSVARQVLRRLDARYPAVGYAAQNIDKRLPPPFYWWERQALARVQGIYPCSRQAASVVVGKGFGGTVRVLPLAPSPLIVPCCQAPPTDVVRLLLAGRLVPEKGVRDAVRVLAGVRAGCHARLLIVGSGPEAGPALMLAASLGVAGDVEVRPWASAAELAGHYGRAHVLLAPSRATRTWAEQFGRMVAEGQAAGAVPVAYRSGALPEVVGDAGVLTPEGDTAAMARAVLGLHANPRDWLRLRDRALAAAPGRRWDVVAQGQLALYQQASAMAPPAAAVRPRRALAATRYGPPAAIAGGCRPFALPALRADTSLNRLLARACDRVAHRDEPAPPQRLRVVFLDHVATPSGAELTLSRLIAVLPNVDAHVILGEDGALRGALEQAGAAVEVLPLDERARDVRRAQLGPHRAAIRAAWLTARYAWQLARRLRELDPDVVHTNSLKSGYYGAVAARLAGKPVIWHLHDRLASDYLPPAAARLTRAAVRWLPDLVVCNSRETRRAAALPAAPAHPVIASPCCLATQPGQRNGAVRTIGAIGRLTPWKGQDVFLRAFATVAAGAPWLEARIIGAALFGEDDYAGRLCDLARDLGIGDRVTFTGFVPDVARELSGLDILVHSSVVPEPFGQVIVEGLAAGVPVVASDAGGPAETITDEENGLLVPPGDEAALAGALRRLIADAGLRARLSAAGPARAADFQSAAIGARVEQAYRDLVLKRQALPQYARDELAHRARELLRRESLAAAPDRRGVPGARAQVADRLRHPCGRGLVHEHAGDAFDG
jgi:glycosyltransferase involved in cell wall biosynthesis